MSPDDGRTLALDLGEARIGIAISDPLGLTAQPLEVLHCVGPRKDLRRIVELVRERDVARVVIGLPLHMSGEESPGARAARQFAERLGSVLPKLTIELWDERLTTVEAERSMIAANVKRRKRRERVDMLAAVLILQGYLDSHGRSRGPER